MMRRSHYFCTPVVHDSRCQGMGAFHIEVLVLIELLSFRCLREQSIAQLVLARRPLLKHLLVRVLLRNVAIGSWGGIGILERVHVPTRR